MATVTPVITAEYLLSASPPVLRLTDVTDYSGIGASHSDTIYGLFQIYDPSGGILYQNSQYTATPPTSGDLTPYAAVAPVTFIDIDLPIDFATNFPELGNYTVNYLLYIHQASGTTLNGYWTVSETYNLLPTLPKVCIDVEVDCICGKYISNDTTNYGTYNTLSVVHTVNYPGGTQLDPEVSSLPSIVVPLYSPGTYTTIITSTINVNLPGGGTATYIVSGSKETSISCAKSVCDVACQIFTLQDAYFDALRCNSTLAYQYKKQLDEITFLMQGINMAMDCGQTEKINRLLNKVYEVGHFQPGGCGCSDDKPQLVSGCGQTITGKTYSAVGSNGVNVYTVSDASGAQFQIQLTPTIYNVVNGLTKTALTAGSNITITPVVSPDGSTTTYTIAANVSGASISISQVTGLQTALDSKQSTTLTSAHLLIGNGSNVATDTALTGDVAITNAGVSTVNAINGVALGSTTATSGNLLIGSGSAWVTNPVSGDITINSSGVTALKNTGTAGTYTSVTTDAQGRVTAGSNPGFITGNQTITLSGDVSGTGTTAITTAIGSNKITNAMLQSNSVASSNIQNGAILSNHYANTSIPTSAYQLASVTGGSGGILAANTITVSNLVADLQLGFFTITASFESNEQGTISFYHPFADSIIINSIQLIVSKTIAASEQGVITFANNVGNMGPGNVNVPMSTTQGTILAAFVPNSNNTISSSTAFLLTTNKPTAGGKVLCTVYYSRL